MLTLLTKVKAHRWLLRTIAFNPAKKWQSCTKPFGYKKLQWLEFLILDLIRAQ
jgi:hypothetical protein